MAYTSRGAKILWDFQIQTDKQVMANQPDIVVVNKLQKKAVVIDIAIPIDSNINKKENKKLEKYQGLKEEVEKMWELKAAVVPVVIIALKAVITKLAQADPVKLYQRSLSRRAQL